jgi:hypothetical protein
MVEGVTVDRCCMDNCLIEVPVARETVVPVYIYPYDALFDHSPAAPVTGWWWQLVSKEAAGSCAY